MGVVSEMTFLQKFTRFSNYLQHVQDLLSAQDLQNAQFILQVFASNRKFQIESVRKQVT